MIGASVLRMRGVEDSDQTFPVVFDSASTDLAEPEFRYDGFVLSAIAVTDYRESVEPPETVSLEVVLSFVDIVGRRATVSLFVDYGFSDSTLNVSEAVAVPLGPDIPEVRMFVVPVDAMPPDAFRSDTTQFELLRLAAANDVAGRQGESLGSVPQEYYLLGFVVDRLWPDAIVELRVSDDPEGLVGAEANSLELDFQGWRVAVLRTVLALNTGDETFVKTIYQPGSDNPPAERAPRLAGVFSSHVSAAATPSGTAATAAPLELDLAPTPEEQSAKDRLIELDELLEQDLITPEEFAVKRQQILDDL